MDSYTALTNGDVGSNIREARMQQGITQAELAGAVGVHRTTIVKVEAGKRAVSAPMLVLFANALGVDVASLLKPGRWRREPRSVLPRKSLTCPHCRRASPVLDISEPSCTYCARSLV